MAEISDIKEALAKCAETGDFAQAVGIMRENAAAIESGMKASELKDALKKTTTDRLFLSFIDACNFSLKPLASPLVRLERLMALRPGTLVFSEKSLEWGLGIVKRLDYFYRKITVDFTSKRGHQFTYDAALDLLTIAPPEHIFAIRHADPARYETLIKDTPGEFVKEVIKSFGAGSMGIQKLEDVCIKCGFVKKDNWKAFWEKAKAALRGDKRVVIPVRKTEPITIREEVEDYGDMWLSAFAHETDPKTILAAVREYIATSAYAKLEPDKKAEATEILAGRLAFSLVAARQVDDALYARIALTITAMKLQNPGPEEMRAYLWERKRFIKASANLPSRDVNDLIAFMATDDAARAKICAAISEFNYQAVQAIISQFATFPEARAAIAKELSSAQAPATLVTLFAGSYNRFKADWPELPPFITILKSAIALGEGRQSGEVLRMQNIIRRLFMQKEWLEQTLNALEPAERMAFFERFQASIAWDASTHHTIVVRMSNIAPELKEHIVKAEKKREYARLTSPRSYAAKKAEYLKLINVDMPENVRRIEFAKGFGDLSENAEYQYAKDEQRALRFKQGEMQSELEAVKADEFKDATTEEVMPGVTVVIETPDGEKTYTVLGEWDNDLERGIISSKTRLALNMLGKKAGENFELPGAGRSEVVFAKIREIRPLSDEIREWMKA